MKKMMVDFWAGFGGMSEAFLRSGRWDILRIDNNPLLSSVPRMVIADCMTLEPYNLGTNLRIEYVHCSFPCQEFSTGFNAVGPTARRAGIDFKPDLKPALKAKELIEKLNPKFWSVENVKGSIKYLEPIFGKPALIIGSCVFWGNFPKFSYDLPLNHKQDRDKRHSPLRSNYRALIPYDISESFMKAIESQKSITDYLG